MMVAMTMAMTIRAHVFARVLARVYPYARARVGCVALPYKMAMAMPTMVMRMLAMGERARM